MSRCWSVGRLDAISLLKSRQYAVSKSYVAATGPRPGCTASTAWGVHGVLGVKRRGKQLVREIDWHLDLGVTELETPQRDNDEYAHAQWYSAQGLCRSSQPRPLALPATPFLAGNCSSPKPRSRIPAAGPADPAFGDLPPPCSGRLFPDVSPLGSFHPRLCIPHEQTFDLLSSWA